MPVNIGEAALHAVVVEAEFLVIEAEGVQGGGVEIVAIRRVLGGLVAEVVCAAVGGAPLGAASGHPGGEGSGVVIAPLALRGGLAAKLGGADDECLVQHASRFQIRDERGGSVVEDGAPVAMIAHEVLVAVPVRADLFGRSVLGSAEDLDKAHAAFDEPTGQKALSAKGSLVLVVQVVELLRGCTLAPNIGDFGGAELESRGEFIRGNAGFEFAIARVIRGVLAIEQLEKIAALLLGGTAELLE